MSNRTALAAIGLPAVATVLGPGEGKPAYVRFAEGKP